MQPAIRVKGVAKRYRLGEREQYLSLRDVIQRSLHGIGRRGGPKRSAEFVWALDDVSFEVARGEVLGLIGRNGAGKSTLLKLICRITPPTKGQIEIVGRVGSLLEVGTGFHPELTGRENIFLNGSILGMSRVEIIGRLDEIIEFSEVAAFMDTPVKHFSVGMYMRLAFAVAAHLSSEVLIVDEVLAVGDAGFQRKCLGKIGEVARSGRTVLFVSHNLEATRQLCDRCILLDHGRLLQDGDPGELIERYLTIDGMGARPGQLIDLAGAKHTGTGQARLTGARYHAAASPEAAPVSDQGLVVEIDVEAPQELMVPSVAMTVSTDTGFMLLNIDTAAAGQPVLLAQGHNRLVITVDRLHLAAGQYRVDLRLAKPVTTRIGSGAIDMVESAFKLRVSPPPDGSSPGAGVVTARFQVG
jgi:lipopolysaccharide transport system ATP-binding protein